MRMIHIEDRNCVLHAIILDKIVYISYGEYTHIKLVTHGVDCNLTRSQLEKLIEEAPYV